MSTTSLITEKGQTTIPKELREKYGIEPGDRVIWEDTEEGIVIRKVVEDAGRGLWVDEDLEGDVREEMARELEDDVRERREAEWAIE